MGNRDTLPPGVLLPDLLRTWGEQIQRQTSLRFADSTESESEWMNTDGQHKEYGNYSEFVES